MIESSSSSLRREILALALMLAVVAAVLLPAVSLRVPMLQNDADHESVPRAIALARTVQSGEIPLWDPWTFAGARPFYVVDQSAPYYLPNYPLLWATDVTNPREATVMLLLLPWALHLLWAAVGAFLYARLGLGLDEVGAAVCGGVWALSPALTFQVFTWDVAIAYGYLPWVLLAVTRYVATGRLGWWLAGVVLVALQTSGGSPNLYYRVTFCTFLAALLLWLFQWRRSGRARPWRLAGGVGMHVLGWGLAACTMAGFILEGLPWIWKNGAIQASIQHGSMHPKHPSQLVELLLPDLWGVTHNLRWWGLGVLHAGSTSKALTGGMAVASCAIAAVMGRRSLTPAPRDAVRLHLVLLIGALVAMMGYYTPLYSLLAGLLPVIIDTPRLTYWQFAACWAMAVLAAIGATAVSRRGAEGARLLGRALLVCLAATAVVLVWALLWRVPWYGKIVAGYRTLLDNGLLGWFVRGPLALAVAAAVGVGLVVRRRLPPAALAAVVVLEAAVVACLQLYDSNLLMMDMTPGHRPTYEDYAGNRRLTIAAQMSFVTDVPAQTQNGRFRFTGMGSELDNQAWTLGMPAALGYASKPLNPCFWKLLEPLVDGRPQELTWRDGRPPTRLLANLSVAVVDDWSRKDIMIDRPLPRLHFQDHVVELDADDQIERLRSSDLRDAVYVEPGALPPDADRDAVGFDRLQSLDVVTSFDESHPNRPVIDVDVQQPAMLVMTDAWHPGWTATVDDRRQPLLRVNGCLRGLWLEPGAHEVDLAFFPASMRAGLWVSAVSALVIGLVTLIAFVTATRDRRKRSPAAGP